MSKERSKTTNKRGEEKDCKANCRFGALKIWCVYVYIPIRFTTNR